MISWSVFAKETTTPGLGSTTPWRETSAHTLPGETTTTAPVESTTTTVAPTTTVVTTTTTTPGATTTTVPPSTVPKSPKSGKGRKAVAPKEFSMKWEESEERPNFFELVASWRIQTAPDRYKITCRQLPLGEKAPIENEIEFDEPTTTKNEEGRTEAKVLLAPAKPLRCELVAMIGSDVSAASNPAIVPPGPRRGVIIAPTTTVPNPVTPTTVPGSPTTTAAPATTPPRPVVTLPKPGNRPTTTTMAPAPTTTVAPPATPAPTTTTPAPATTTTVVAPTTTAAAAAQPAPQPSSPVTTPRNQPSPPATSRAKKG